MLWGNAWKAWRKIKNKWCKINVFFSLSYWSESGKCHYLCLTLTFSHSYFLALFLPGLVPVLALSPGCLTSHCRTASISFSLLAGSSPSSSRATRSTSGLRPFSAPGMMLQGVRAGGLSGARLCLRLQALKGEEIISEGEREKEPCVDHLINEREIYRWFSSRGIISEKGR